MHQEASFPNHRQSRVLDSMFVLHLRAPTPVPRHSISGRETSRSPSPFSPLRIFLLLMPIIELLILLEQLISNACAGWWQTKPSIRIAHVPLDTSCQGASSHSPRIVFVFFVDVFAVCMSRLTDSTITGWKRAGTWLVDVHRHAFVGKDASLHIGEVEPQLAAVGLLACPLHLRDDA